ncbi:MAG: sugar transferase [Flavisolibacter sp.]|jgi:lipopolysaccharide/colanic/teichoic acid biosynthesis glycosyltransferase|nr:sugar transferase [Flavisolibacter sp.]
MQVEILKNVASEARKKLRVATVTKEQSDIFFLYIGNNESSIKFLLNTSSSGLIAETLQNACDLVRTEDFKDHGIDVIILDLPFESIQIKEFTQFLKQSGKIDASIPVIYNEELIKNQKTAVAALVDDVIDLSNWQFDFSSKISFLKQIKQYEKPKSTQFNFTISDAWLKRTFDIVVSSLLIIMALPVFLLVAFMIRIESKGPLFYNAKRAGRGFRIFKFYKFRTMVINADKKIDALAHLNQYADASNGAKFFKIANDPRITKVGKFLRNTSLDELPQLFNVLKGDMSLVGNRPLPLYEAATLTTNEFVERFMAPAGITGLWQIKKRGQSDMSVEERISLDISYARKSNIMFDLWIMANTPAALLQKSDV